MAAQRSSQRIVRQDARAPWPVAASSVQLVVTSPPYPMIEMWDAAFRAMSPQAAEALDAADGPAAFEAMHAELDEVWSHAFEALCPGGLLCVNVGDATRTLGGDFALYSNHARILTAAQRCGFTVLPDILWRKPTNAPNKFMGSGMLPAGAYVTYEHEYVLILRKGGKRTFSRAEDKARRRQSAFFWEERNVWFSDVWMSLRGTRQALPGAEVRERSAAFPFELPWRLIQMFSCYGDTVLDPFLGTGTSLLASAASARNGVGLELEGELAELADESLEAAVELGRERTAQRIADHKAFVDQRQNEGKAFKHHNAAHDFPVITSQERELELWVPQSGQREADGNWSLTHAVE